ncbi:MAG: baseplate J/gp47 family protein, partial [Myxococcota bacterium]
PATRPRMEKIFDPSLIRFTSAEFDESFAADPAEPGAVRLRFSLSDRAPHAAWQLEQGARVSASEVPAGGGGAVATPTPDFLTEETVTLIARSGWVWADSVLSGSDQNVPIGSLSTIVSSDADPEIIGNLEVDQLVSATGGESGQAEVLLRFRMIEGAPPASGTGPGDPIVWEVPADTIVRYIEPQSGAEVDFKTRNSLIIGLGGGAVVKARAEVPGAAGNVPAGTLDQVLPESRVRLGNVVDSTVMPYVSVDQSMDAQGGGPPFDRAQVQLDVAISERAPRTAWLIPRDTRLVRESDPDLLFETIDPLPVLPRSGWVWAEPTGADPVETVAESVLTTAVNLDPELSERVEITQPEAAQDSGGTARVRVWFRLIDRAEPAVGSDSWTIPAGTEITDDGDNIVFATVADLALSYGGVAIAVTEANRTGMVGNNVADIAALANPEDFESQLIVTQKEPARGGADGGSDGHHHGDEPGALPSHPLADGAVGAEQIAEGAVTWSKLSDELAGRFLTVRDSLKSVEDALIEAGALEALMTQRHRTVE